MSVLIRGMQKPDNCKECRMRTDYDFCSAMPKEFCGYTDDIRCPDWCPLVDLRIHGDLKEFIDVTTTVNEDDGTQEVNLGEVFAAYFKMREAPVVIEAEEGD